MFPVTRPMPTLPPNDIHLAIRAETACLLLANVLEFTPLVRGSRRLRTRSSRSVPRVPDEPIKVPSSCFLLDEVGKGGFDTKTLSPPMPLLYSTMTVHREGGHY